MMAEIAICGTFSPQQLARLKQIAGDDELRLVTPEESCRSPIVFGNPDPEVIAANSDLRWLQLESVGFGEYSALGWGRADSEVVVTNLAGFFAEPVAESALAGILALYRGIDALVRNQADGRWVGDPLRTKLKTLRHANVVLFGFGAINSRLAQLLVPFDCAIAMLTTASAPGALDEALARADIVVCTVPATLATHGVFDSGRLARMPPGAMFCNFGRGSVVDEVALADALGSGRLGGAVIDVTEEEPLPPNHRFWTLPNLILTQHSGGGSMDELDRKIDVFLSNLTRFRAGMPLENVVDFTRGY
jgi:phosphoglycerate dehydrogenase-like enzyme